MAAGPAVERAPRKLVAITGTSRDVGKFAAYGFAQAGYDLIGGFRNPKHLDSHNALIAEIKDDYKVRMDFVQGDISDEATREGYAQKVEEFGDGLDVLVLNAAGGYRRRLLELSPAQIEAQFEEARKINVDAQLSLLHKLSGFMNPGGVVIYETSDPAHRAHLLGSEREELMRVLGDYATVAESKNRSERLLRSMIPELSAEQLRLAIVVGNGLDGSFVTKALKRSDKETTDQWLSRTEQGHFPIVMQMSVGIVEIARTNYPSGYTEYVGLSLKNQLYPGGLPQ